MSLTNISSDVFNNICTYFIIVTFIAGLFIELIKVIAGQVDEKFHVFSLICFLTSMFSAAYLAYESFTTNITSNVGGILDVSLFGYVLIFWVIAMAICCVITLKELVYDGYDSVPEDAN
jgi:hypothetical protein